MIAVLAALAGMQGLKFSLIFVPATLEFNSNTIEPVMVLATVIGPIAAVPPVALAVLLPSARAHAVT